MNEERERLRAFLADLQAACAKHGCVIKCWDEMGIALGAEGTLDQALHLQSYGISATEAHEAEWHWEEDEQRVAGKPPDRRFFFTSAPDLPQGTLYMAKTQKREKL